MTTFDVTDLFLSLLETAWTVAVSFEVIINVVENVQKEKKSMDRGGERKQSVVVVKGLDGPLSVSCFVT